MVAELGLNLIMQLLRHFDDVDPGQEDSQDR